MKSPSLLRAIYYKTVKVDFKNVADPILARKLGYLNSATLIGILILLGYIVFDLKNQTGIVLINDGVTLVGFTATNLMIRFTKKYKAAFTITLLILSYSLVGILYAARADRSIYWVPTFPIVAYFLTGRAGGVIWTASMAGALYLTLLLDRYDILKLRINASSVGYVTIVMLGISALLYANEVVNSGNEKLIERRDREISEVNEKLSRELAKKEAISELVTSNLAISQKSNQELEDTKTAMLNLLEDSQELQEQLKEQKGNVERKILLRTEELRDARLRLETSINSIEGGLLMTFRDGRYSYNAAFIKLLNIDSDQVGGLPSEADKFIDILQDKLGKEFDLRKAVLTCIGTSAPFHLSEISFHDKIFRISGTPIIDVTQKVTHINGVVVFIQDVTEASTLERSKNEFISIASHELRTPLTAIRGNADMLQQMYGDKLPNDDMREMLNDIHDASTRLIGVVNEFLNMSRLEQKRAVFDIVATDPKKTISKVVDGLTPLVNSKNVHLKLDVPDNLPYILTDPSRLEEVVSNLVDNAIKYGDGTDVMITAKIKGTFLAISITDSGKGVPAAQRHLLFHKFQQAGSDILTRDVSRSTGLGLYICRLLVEQLGGTIYIEDSPPGSGATFTFTQRLADISKLD